MAAEKQVANSTPTKPLRNADGSITKLTEFATADINSVEELETLFGSQGVSYSRGEEVTGDYKAGSPRRNLTNQKFASREPLRYPNMSIFSNKITGFGWQALATG